MKIQRQCLILSILCGFLNFINGQTFPAFGQTQQGQGNPALFQQFLQTRQAATGTAGAATGTGFGTQQTFPNQVRTVTVPVLPAPSDGFGEDATLTQFQSATTGNQIPIPRFGSGTGTVTRTSTQFTQGANIPQQGLTMNNAAMMAARQRQLALMRQNALFARQQAATANAGSPFDGLGLAPQNQMTAQQSADNLPQLLWQQQNGFPMQPAQMQTAQQQAAAAAAEQAQQQAPQNQMTAQQSAGNFPQLMWQQQNGFTMQPAQMQMAQQQAAAAAAAAEQAQQQAPQNQMTAQQSGGTLPQLLRQQQNGFTMQQAQMQAAQQQAAAAAGQTQQQALARVRAAGGLPPFAFLNRQAMAGAGQPPFGMFPSGMPGQMQGGGARFTGAANALNQQTATTSSLTPIINPRDPRIGIMPNLGPLGGFGSPQRPFPFPSQTGAAAARAATNRLNTASTTTRRTGTNNITPMFPQANAITPEGGRSRMPSQGMAAFAGAQNIAAARRATMPQTIAAFPGGFPGPALPTFPQGAANRVLPGPDVAAFPGAETNSMSTVSGSSSVTNDVQPSEVSAFPGVQDTSGSTGSSASVALESVAEFPAFPGTDAVSSNTGTSDFPGFPGRTATVGSGATSVDTSGSPVLFSLTVNGGEAPLQPGELPPPPPVFPARDIDNIPASADAALFPSLEVGSSLTTTERINSASVPDSRFPAPIVNGGSAFGVDSGVTTANGAQGSTSGVSNSFTSSGLERGLATGMNSGMATTRVTEQSGSRSSTSSSTRKTSSSTGVSTVDVSVVESSRRTTNTNSEVPAFPGMNTIQSVPSNQGVKSTESFPSVQDDPSADVATVPGFPGSQQSISSASGGKNSAGGVPISLWSDQL